MYFPVLRSRQFELLAIRELVENKLLSPNICPVIEPVKTSTSLIRTLKLFHESNLPICLIINPEYGTFRNELAHNIDAKFTEDLIGVIGLQNVKLMYRLDPRMRFGNFLQLLGCGEELSTIEYLLIDSQNTLEDTSLSLDAFKYVLHPDERPFRHGPKWENKIVLDDCFKSYPRNADYAKNIDEPFSDWHLYYKDDNYFGFSDYSIVGNNYSEAGFAPRAVTIHLVYPDSQDKLRIKHFVSDSNDSISDTAGKFGEALNKLTNSQEMSNLNTFALQAFSKYQAEEKYPGLGVVKKLCIMHHLELIDRFLRSGKFHADL